MNPFEKFLQTKGYNVASFKALDTEAQANLQNEYLGSIESKVDAAPKQSDIDAFKTQIEGFKTERDAEKEEITKLKATVEAQGLKITELNKTSSESKKMRKLDEVFQEKYEEAKGDKDELQLNEQICFSTKDIISTDVMSVSTVGSEAFPASGSTGIVSSTMQTIWGKLLGWFGLRSPKSMILDLIDVSPMDAATLIVINDQVVGDAEITPECTLKPIVKYTPSVQTADAGVVAAMWFTTTKLRRFFPALVNRMQEKFAELVNDKIPAVTLTAVKNGATAFTPNAAFAINTNPNNYDALGAVIASIENLGLVPNAIILNPIAWRNMKQDKTNDGVYTLSNGQSISILQNGLDWGGVNIPIIKDPTIGVDEFIVGDLFAAVKAGVDTELMYMETDGRTDEEDSSVTGLQKNIRTHVLEKFYAVIVPNGTKAGLISDTFSNVKTLITAESPSV